MSYAQPMQTKHALRVLAGVCTGLLAGCADFAAVDDPDDGGTETTEVEPPNPTGVSAGWNEDETTGGEGSGEGGGCGNEPACSAATPFCVDGACLGCDALENPDEACAATDPENPVCSALGCVECGATDDSLCIEDAPVCADDGQCRGCSAHDECETACDFETGWCFDEAVVVGEDGVTAAGALSAALEGVEPGGRIAIRWMPGAECILDTVTVAEGRSVALLGEPGARPCLTSWDDRAAITVTDGSSLYLLDVRIEESYGMAVEVRGASLYAERVELVNNSGGAVSISQDAYLHLRNAMVGGDRNNVPVLRTHTSTLDVAYSSVVAGFGDAQGIVCDGDNAVSVRNSIVLSEGSIGEIDCPQAEVSYSALEAVFGEGNVAVGAVDTGRWFENYPGGDLHLRYDTLGMPFEDVAQWVQGDPLVDLDGDPRPGVEQAQDWAGADIP